MELYESPTTKELKKKHSSRPVEGAETGSQVERIHGKATEQEDWGRQGGGGQSSWGGILQTGQSHICVWIKREEQLGSQTDHATQGSSVGK